MKVQEMKGVDAKSVARIHRDEGAHLPGISKSSLPPGPLLAQEEREEETAVEMTERELTRDFQWNGDFKTAMDYFWDVGQLASLSGWMPNALGFWLPSRLTKGSPVHLWFSIQPSRRQAEMRSHYLVYLRVIKESYLGAKWQLVMNLEFEQQAFRQAGHEGESPQTFIGHRTKAVRMLANLDDGGPMEVFLVMRKAPIAWRTILVLENIRSSGELYERVNEHDEALVESVKRSSSEAVTMTNLAAVMKRMGYAPNSSASGPRQFRRANFTEAEDEGLEGDPATSNEIGNSADLSDGEETIRQVYQTLKKLQRPPPPGGYKSAKNDHVTTKMGKKPPSPCKLTDKGTVIKGYTKLKILMLTTSGELLETEVEAYVVKGMGVPILLGEDYQLNYELGVSRSLEEGTKVLFKDAPYEVEANGVEPFIGRAEVHSLAAGLTTHSRRFTQAKEHHRAKARRQRRTRRNGGEQRTIRAAEDYRIRAHECKVIRVDGDFSDDREWLVEKNLLANSEDTFFTVPNVLISARAPKVPVSNMSDKP
ncbi:hypothetical protein FB451DRAFT_1413427 [Mycena latifolia]|nr:hypothetical protein FB451DRAFT_1413427 [Mycena latifolia]